MKKYVFIMMVVFMASCHSTKKAVKTEVETASETKIEQAATSSYDARLVNDIISALKMKITSTEYFPPSAAPGADQAKGAVKSETTLEMTSETVDQSTAEIKQGEQVNTSIGNKEETKTKTEVKEKPAPDPKRWMWIFFILALIAAGILYLKRTPIFKAVKSVLSSAGKKLKI